MGEVARQSHLSREREEEQRNFFPYNYSLQFVNKRQSPFRLTVEMGQGREKSLHARGRRGGGKAAAFLLPWHAWGTQPATTSLNFSTMDGLAATMTLASPPGSLSLGDGSSRNFILLIIF